MYYGIIIEESLQNKSVLDEAIIQRTNVEAVTVEHATPWLKQWTMHVVEIHENAIESFVHRLQDSFETEHRAWYADFKSDYDHHIVFPERIFHIDQSHKEQYDEAVQYGATLGIPRHQLDFDLSFRNHNV